MTHKTYSMIHTKRFNELVEPTQQTQNILTLDHTSIVSDENITDTLEINTYTHSFTVVTCSNILNIPTRQIEHNTN